jgi:hypothetical protein
LKEIKKQESRQTMSPEGLYWWIAMNRETCVMATIPLSASVTVSPVPQTLIGFATEQEARASQQILLDGSIEEMERHRDMLKARASKGEILIQHPQHPEQPTRGTTIWSTDSDVTKLKALGKANN